MILRLGSLAAVAVQDNITTDAQYKLSSCRPLKKQAVAIYKQTMG